MVIVDESGPPTRGNTVSFRQSDRFMAGSARGLGQPGPRDRRSRVFMRNYPMLSVAVGAHRRIGIAPFDQLAVNAVPIIFRGILMASATGIRDVEMIDRRIGMPLRIYLVGRSFAGMAVVACGSSEDTILHRTAMNAALIYVQGMVCPDLVPLDQIQICVALPTGLREIDGVGPGKLSRGWNDIMIPVTIGAGRDLIILRMGSPSVDGVFFTGIFMTGDTPLPTHQKAGIFFMGHRSFIAVTIQTLHTLMCGMR